MGSAQVEVQMVPLTTRFDPVDENWALQCDDLRRDLIASVPGARRVAVAQAGTKGVAEDIIIALGGAESFALMVGCFRYWLDLDRTRRVQLTWTGDTGERSVTIDAKGLSEQAVMELAGQIIRGAGS